MKNKYCNLYFLPSIRFYTNSRHNETESFLAQSQKNGNTVINTCYEM